MGGVVEITAGTGVHCGDEHKIGGVADADVGARDGDFAVFEGLAKGLEDGARVFGDFVEEEDAVMSHRDFAWGGVVAAADDGSGAGGVVWGAERAGMDEGVRLAGEGMEFGDGDLLAGGEGWKEVGGDASEESFAGARRTREEDIVMAGDGDDEGAFGEVLAANVV